MGLFERIRSRLRPNAEAEMLDDLDRLAASPSSWGRLPPERLEGLLLCQLLIYGKTNDPARIPGLLALYQHALRVLPVARRHALLQQVTGAVAANLATAHTFMPFIIVDPAAGVASSAALDYTVLLPPRDADPLTGPKELLSFSATAPNEQVRIAILVGLLLLGDRRVVELLEGCWTHLTPAGQQQLAGAWSGFAYAPVIEFFADWLSRLDDREDEAVFGAVVGALARIPQQAQPAAVLEIERVFPATAAADGNAVIERQRWSFAEFGQRIAPTLLEVAEREREPRIMPMVLSAWGIAPNQSKTPAFRIGDSASSADEEVFGTWRPGGAEQRRQPDAGATLMEAKASAASVRESNAMRMMWVEWCPSPGDTLIGTVRSRRVPSEWVAVQTGDSAGAFFPWWYLDGTLEEDARVHIKRGPDDGPYATFEVLAKPEMVALPPDPVAALLPGCPPTQIRAALVRPHAHRVGPDGFPLSEPMSS